MTTLAHSRLSAPGATPTRWLVWLHGIFGRGENLRALAAGLCAQRPEWGAVLVDLRMHGDSQAFSAPHTLGAATDDVRALLAELPDAHAVAGHSFGGKVALGLLDAPPRGIERLFVLDAAPGARRERSASDTTLQVLDALRALPARLASRAEFATRLGEHGISAALTAWLAKNLSRQPDGGLRFTLDVNALGALLDDHDHVELWPHVEAPPAGVALHFVVAGRSHVVSAADRARLTELSTRGVLSLDVLPEAGHWLHVDDLQGVLDAMARALA